MESFHTVPSLVLSIVFYILTISFTIVFGIDLINRTNPKVVTEIQNPPNYTDYNITNPKLTFAWRLEDGDSVTINFTGILYPKVVLHNYIRNKTTKAWLPDQPIIIEAERCTPEIVNDPKFTSKFDMREWNCIDFTKYNISLGGFWDTDFVKYLELKFYYCPENNPLSSLCTSLDELQLATSSRGKMFFSCIYPEHYFEPNNLVDPLSYVYVNYFTTMSANLQKMNRLFLKKSLFIR